MNKIFTFFYKNQRVLFVAMLLLSSLGLSAQLASWTFEPNPGTNSPTSSGANITASDATFNLVPEGVFGDTYFVGNASDMSYAASNWSDAEANNLKYIEFAVTPALGYALRVDSISFDLRRSSTGPRAISVLVSEEADFVLNSAFGNSTNTPLTGTNFATFKFSEVISNDGTIYFRVLGSQADNTSGMLLFDNIIVYGEAFQPSSVNCTDVTVYLDETATYTITAPEVTTAVIIENNITLSESNFNATHVDSTISIEVIETVALDTCTATVTVLDTISPVLTLTPTTVTLNSQGEAMLTIDAVAQATDNVSVDALTLDRALVFDCSDIGILTITATAVDQSGNTSTGVLEIEVLFEEPSIGCIGEINVVLNENCSSELIIEQVVAGNTSCLDLANLELIIEDTDQSNGAIIDGCGSYNYVVRTTTDTGANITLENFTSCWGVVNAEDKISPTIADSITAPTELFCNELVNITINTLSADVSRCFEVNNNGTPISSNFYNTALGQRLAAGSATGLIPTFTDGCSGIEICVTDYITSNGSCADAVITRTYTARDGDCTPLSGEYNDPTVFSYEITFTRPTIVNAPTQVVEFECSDDIELLSPNSRGDANPSPAITNYPYIIRDNGERVYLDNALCNIGATFEDSPRLVTCTETYKFVRTWTVIDWCDVSNIQTFTQLIKVGDFTAPTITAPTQDLNFDGIPDQGPLFFTTNTAECAAIFQIPVGHATDNCDGAPEVTAFIYPNRDTLGLGFGPYAVGDFTLAGIPMGTHTLRYTATDACGNNSRMDVDITIGDRTVPVAFCEDGLNISVGGPIGTNGGFVQLCAQAVNRASYDACSDIDMKIRITHVEGIEIPSSSLLYQFEYCHTLTCNELGTVRVELRVTDDANRDGLYQDGIDNQNSCWTDILLEDKLAPVCIPPAPVTVNCGDLDQTLPHDLEAAFEASEEETITLLDAAFGIATGLDNCPNAVVTQTVADNRGNCGTGLITRTFTTVDEAMFSSASGCTQTITVQSIHDYTIIFPADESSNECIEPDYNAVSYTESGCDLITTSTTIDTFRSTSDECYKLRIQYEVMNWCEYNTISSPYIIPRDADNDDNFEEITVLHIEPFNEGDADDVAYLDRDEIRDNENIIDELDVNDNGLVQGTNNQGYGTDPSRGAFTYIQFIKVYDETPPVLTIDQVAPICDNDGDCVGDVQVSFNISDLCSFDRIQYRVELDEFPLRGEDQVLTLAEFSNDRVLSNNVTSNGNGSFTVNADGVALGTHAIRITAFDGCGNSDVELIEFTVVDCKAPTPICINGLTATLMPDGQGGGMAAIWAVDFIASPSTDCSGPIKYVIYRETEASSPAFPGPNSNHVGLELNCEDLGSIAVRVYAIDGAGQADYCITTLSVQAFAPTVCEPEPDLGALAGDIMTEQGQFVAGVSVSITGNEGRQTTTNAQGQFSFTDVYLGQDYTIFPYLDSDHMNGVSTRDILMISRHILGLNPITNNYQLIAADANDSKAITVIDIIVIRKLILGLENDFDNNTSWRFIDADYEFPLEANPWATTFPEVANFNNLAGNEFASFIAVKVGDVSGNADPSRALNYQATTVVEARSNVELSTDVEQLTSGTVTTIPVYTSSTLTGLQATIELNEGLELIEVLDGQASATENFGYSMISRGLLTFSYTQPLGTIDEESPLFSLVVRSNNDLATLDAIDINSSYTTAEAYHSSGETFNIELAIDGIVIADGKNQLYQNAPNPVNEFTTINFELANARAVQIVVSDMNGRELLTRQVEGVTGYNSLRLDAKHLTTGILNYTIVAGDFIATKQMVVIR